MRNILNYLYNEIEYLLFSTLMIVVILPKTVQLAFYIAILFVLLMKKGFKIKFNGVTIAMLMLFCVHVFSIVYNIVIWESSLIRVLAAINTSMLWLISALFYSYYSDTNNEVDTKKIGRYCFFNIVFLFMLALVSIYLYFIKGHVTIECFGKLLFTTTYINEAPKIRFVGLNDFSNMNLICIVIMSMMAHYYVKDKNAFIKIVCLIMSSVEVFLIHSRSGMVLFSICIFFTVVIYIKPQYRLVTIMWVGILGLLITLFNYDLLFQLFLNKVLYGNQSSTSLRMEIMETSIKEVMKKSPVWGMGVKRYLYEGYPLGSHSTYIGILYKTGIIGVVLGAYIFYTSNYKSIKNNKNIMVIVCLFCLLAQFALEDVDGTNWCIVLYFSVLAILQKNTTEMKKGIVY